MLVPDMINLKIVLPQVFPGASQEIFTQDVGPVLGFSRGFTHLKYMQG